MSLSPLIAQMHIRWRSTNAGQMLVPLPKLVSGTIPTLAQPSFVGAGYRDRQRVAELATPTG